MSHAVLNLIILAVLSRSVYRVCGAHFLDRAHFEEMSQRWLAVGSTASDLTDPILEAQTYRIKDERVSRIKVTAFILPTSDRNLRCNI